jgi:hypothetical protein
MALAAPSFVPLPSQITSSSSALKSSLFSSCYSKLCCEGSNNADFGQNYSAKRAIYSAKYYSPRLHGYVSRMSFGFRWAERL